MGYTPGKPIVTVLIPQRTRASVLTQQAEQRLAELAEVVSPVDPQPDRWDLGGLLTGATACLTGWGTPALSDALLARLPHLKLIAHTAGTIRRLLPFAALRRGLKVSHAAAVIADAVAEMVVLQVLMHLRMLHKIDRGMKERVHWPEVLEREPVRLLGALTVGVIGAGHVGRAVIKLLKAFGSQVCVYDPLLAKEDASRLGVDLVSLSSLLVRSDIITLHAPSLAETRGMLGAAELELVRDGALFINTARAAIVDQEALVRHLRSGRISAALDVFEPEPLPDHSELRQLPNVILSPHVAGYTTDTRYRQGEAMVAEVDRLFHGRPLMFEIDPDKMATLA